MKFDELNNTIPYAKGGKEKVLRMSPYPNITLAMPGRHAEDTIPKGGDFVVMVTDQIFPRDDHQFKHSDIFNDLANRKNPTVLMNAYNKIINGESPESIHVWTKGTNDAHLGVETDCMNPWTFLRAVQCLAVAEHRRYAQYENKFGGRFLPFRFAAGIAEGLWTVNDALAWERKGRPGVEKLEKDFGTPILTKELMA